MVTGKQIVRQRTVLVVVTAFIAFIAFAYISDWFSQQGSITPLPPKAKIADQKGQREVDKLSAEIRHLRSETAGSLFWLKLIGGIVTVGGAIGGYFLAQRETNKERLEFEDRKEEKRLEFEHRKDVDAAYQAIVQELTTPERPLLRAAAAMKLGSLLQDFPSEWNVSSSRKEQLRHQTKQLLAIALATETEPKVRKAMTIAIALDSDSNLRELDLSGTQAANAYWAKKDFTGTDFFGAVLTQASFRQANLQNAQFRSANLKEAVLVEANCVETNFKFADLSHADLSNTNMAKAIFVDTDLQGADLRGAKNLSLDQVKCAKNWEQAIYNEDFLTKLGSPAEPTAGNIDNQRRK
jgi:hypothetical protein